MSCANLTRLSQRIRQGRINDLDTSTRASISAEESYSRTLLASLLRLIDYYGWSQSIYNHISLRTGDNHILTNPFGLLFAEVTASTLVKVNLSGKEVVDSGITNLGVNKTELALHYGIHAARQDAKCVIHLHTPSVVAVSATKEGLLFMSQESLIVGQVPHYYYKSLAAGKCSDELNTEFGLANNVLMLCNHGFLCVGETVEEAFFWALHTVSACQSQVKCMSMGSDVNTIMEYEFEEEVGDRFKGYHFTSQGSTIHMPLGALEYEAHMRFMDSMGLETGYKYVNKDLFRISRPTPDVEKAHLPDHLQVHLPFHRYSDSEFTENLGEFADDRSQTTSTGNTQGSSDFSESSIPYSESSKELIMYINYMIHEDAKLGRSLTPQGLKTGGTLDSVPYRNPRDFTKREVIQRRSKSLTSGVEKAIFRRINEKVRSEIR